MEGMENLRVLRAAGGSKDAESRLRTYCECGPRASSGWLWSRVGRVLLTLGRPAYSDEWAIVIVSSIMGEGK